MLGLVNASASVVEPLTGLSIIWVAVRAAADHPSVAPGSTGLGGAAGGAVPGAIGGNAGLA